MLRKSPLAVSSFVFLVIVVCLRPQESWEIAWIEGYLASMRGNGWRKREARLERLTDSGAPRIGRATMRRSVAAGGS